MASLPASVPKIVPTPSPSHEIENVLAFRTKPGGETIEGGQSKDLGTVDVSHFDKIRIVADERVGSTCDVFLRMTITEGAELVAFLDHILLQPHSQMTRVYDVPGVKLTIAIDGVGAAGTKGAVDVLLYGQY